MRRWKVLIEPTVPILLLASIVHVVRHNVVDLVVFAGTALLIVVDAGRVRGPAARIVPSGDGAAGPGPAPSSSTRSRHLWWGSVVALFAVAAAVLPYAGTVIRALLVVLGVGLAALVALRPAPAVPGPDVSGVSASADASSGQPAAPAAARGWSIWAVVGVLACLWELAAFSFQQVDPAAESQHPTVSDLVDPLMASRLGRAVFVLLWGAAGVWLIRRLVGTWTDHARTRHVRAHTPAESPSEAPQ